MIIAQLKPAMDRSYQSYTCQL